MAYCDETDYVDKYLKMFDRTARELYIYSESFKTRES